MALPTIENSTTSSANQVADITFTIPSGSQADDILLLCMSVDDSDTVQTASGYTRIYDYVDTVRDCRQVVDYKVLTGADSGTFTLTLGNPQERAEGILMLIRGADTSTPFQELATDFVGLTTSVSYPSATTTRDDSLVFALSTCGNGDQVAAGFPSPGWTSLYNNDSGIGGTGGASVSQHLAYYGQATAGSVTSGAVFTPDGTTFSLLTFAVPAPEAVMGGGEVTQTVEWTALTNAIDTAGFLTCTSSSTPSGGRGTVAVTVADYFRLEWDVPNDTEMEANVTYLSDTTDQSYAWNSNADVVTGAFWFSGDLYTANVGGGSNGATSKTLPTRIKMEKSGDDVIYSYSDDSGSSWTVFYTDTGILTGHTTLYIKSLFAIATTSKKVSVELTTGADVGGKINYYNGSAFVEKPVKYYNGSAWVEKPLKYYNGSEWVLT